ncbi:hypothetical protein CGC20_15895 [Leishmania donovani]|uniref:Uncharacterized protein n=1 Tax=Leishmania donovani TaxID=5661 RepID=A0A504XUT5_LEIDO|nr:hypothetical protein CGC21_2470 [Leishmania donovani]TPP52413.1 hypothetical protein CGC20_15895 [Leishmania donovani]
MTALFPPSSVRKQVMSATSILAPPCFSRANPCDHFFPMFVSAVNSFGPECVVSFSAVYILTEGLVKTLLSTSQYVMMMNGHVVDTAAYQRMTGDQARRASPSF